MPKLYFYIILFITIYGFINKPLYNIKILTEQMVAIKWGFTVSLSQIYLLLRPVKICRSNDMRLLQVQDSLFDGIPFPWQVNSPAFYPETINFSAWVDWSNMKLNVLLKDIPSTRQSLARIQTQNPLISYESQTLMGCHSLAGQLPNIFAGTH